MELIAGNVSLAKPERSLKAITAEIIYHKWLDKGKNASETARALQISRMKVYRFIREYQSGAQ